MHGTALVLVSLRFPRGSPIMNASRMFGILTGRERENVSTRFVIKLDSSKGKMGIARVSKGEFG